MNRDERIKSGTEIDSAAGYVSAGDMLKENARVRALLERFGLGTISGLEAYLEANLAHWVDSKELSDEMQMPFT